MQAYQVQTSDGYEDIKRIDLPEPEIAADEVLVRMRACSLNFRDLLIPQGGYPRNETRPVIPLSDGAGEVVQVGADVTGLSAGDRVMGNFFQDWVDGRIDARGLHSALGGGIDGTLAEYFKLKGHAALPIPEHLDYEEAATLPCAALTAWHALVPLGAVKAGDTVLAEGTGGVSIFGLQFCKALGANVIVTSSSDEKLARAKALGADHLVNYVTHPDWEEPVLEATGGMGVDHVLEVGGEQTFAKAIAATRVYGTISVIGIVSGTEIPINLLVALNLLRINGIYVGSVEMFREMNRFIGEHRLRPVVDQVFDFDDALDAYRYLASAKHFGKVVISHA